jgi:hypothetical protein
VRAGLYLMDRSDMVVQSRAERLEQAQPLRPASLYPVGDGKDIKIVRLKKSLRLSSGLQRLEMGGVIGWEDRNSNSNSCTEAERSRCLFKWLSGQFNQGKLTYLCSLEMMLDFYDLIGLYRSILSRSYLISGIRTSVE